MANTEGIVFEKLDPPRTHWQLHKRSQPSAYALALLELSDIAGSSPGAGMNNLFLDIGAISQEIFEFTVAPQSIEVEEPSASTIIPTQDGRQYIEHQGQIYKTITIQGTTGLRPDKKITPVQPPGNAGIPSDERTGFDILLDLKNLFRLYWGAKTTDEVAHEVVMVWQNGRDGEYFIVEPIQFKTSRDASNPLTTQYNIQLRTIERLDFSPILLTIPDPHLERQKGLLDRIEEIGDRFSDALTVVNSKLSSYIAAANRGVNQVLGPANEILEGINTIGRSASRALTLEAPRAQINELLNNSVSIFETLQGVSASYSNGLIDDPARVANALKNLGWASAELLGIDDLFGSRSQDKIGRTRATYTDPIGGSSTQGNDPTSIFTAEAGNSTGSATINGGEDIRKVAKRLLGNSGKWKTLVLVNNLKPPYISPTGDGINVLRPGDRIQYPSTSSRPETAVAKDRSEPGKQNQIESTYGRDLKLSRITSVGEVDLFDFQVNEKGDLATVEGLDNMEQAVLIKFNTERGELPLHPRFGVKLPIGIKAPGARSFTEFQIAARSSILSDRRILDVANFRFSLDGNAIDIKARMLLRGSSQQLDLDFGVKR